MSELTDVTCPFCGATAVDIDPDPGRPVVACLEDGCPIEGKEFGLQEWETRAEPVATKVVYPFGWLAGKEGEAHDVIQALAIEMLGDSSDLMEQARHEKDQGEQGSKIIQAVILEKYGVMLEVIYFQMEPEKRNLDACDGLLELAKKHHITVPPWISE